MARSAMMARVAFPIRSGSPCRTSAPAIDPPIGFSRAKVGVERMAINCAVCHTVRARLTADAEPQFYVGAAANTVDIQGYLRFLSRCAADDRFTPDHLLPAM